MSYDIRLTDPVTEETLHADAPHQIAGGTLTVGGTTELWLNITYNYGMIFRRVLGEDSIRALYGKTGAEALPMLEQAISQLGDDVSDDYWEATEGNAKRALLGIKAFAQIRPDGVFQGD
jgi:hypothetical protein